jgi:hypothetical protein
LLKPTKLNLFGLDIRFRYTEELLRKEKESKKIAVLTFQSDGSRVSPKLTLIRKRPMRRRPLHQGQVFAGRSSTDMACLMRSRR